jgi:predicted PurR-regulated permease PerM
LLAAIPAIIIAFFVSPLTAIIVAALFILVQELEGHIIVPKIMQKTVGLSPVTIILAILIGGKLYGFLGIILAVPLAAGVSVFWHEWRKVAPDEKAIERPVSK